MTTPATQIFGAELTREQRSQALRRVVWATMITATILLALQIIEDPATLRRRGISIVFTDAFGLLALWLNRRGRTGVAGGVFIGSLIFVITWRAWTLGGLDAPVTAGYVVMVGMAGLLLGRVAGAAMAAVTAALTLALITARVEGWLPRQELSFTPLGLWLSNCIWIALAFSLQGQIAASFRVALARAERELEQRRRSDRQLGERVKELRLLHAAATLLQRSHGTALDAFRELVELIPAAWQHHDVCAARITFGDAVAVTPNWRATEWRMAKSFTTEEGDGTIEVVYLQPRPQADEGPFIAEERAVLDSLADMLVAYVELRRRRQGLEQLVATRTRELSIARDEADRASRAKSVFLASMSHEIRTPLNAVLGHAQLLQREPALVERERERRSVDAILSSGSHLLTIINDVLETSKMEAGRTKLLIEPMDLHATLTDVEHMFIALIRNKGLVLTVERDESVPRAIRGDAPKIRQVLINLLGNAVKFTERGSVHVRAAAEQARITISVTDTGSGIAAHDQARIFSAFEQAEQGMRAGGTGLGLTISQSFARMMRGDITLDSRVGEGSTFTFSFIADTTPLSDLAVPEMGVSDSLRPDRPAPPPVPALAPLLATLPPPLRAELREAAVLARTTRLQQLTEQVSTMAPDAARAITTVVESFRYDDLVTAIDSSSVADRALAEGR